jgi:hypothetical protein
MQKSRYEKLKALAYALRSDTDECILWTWAKQPGGYGIISKNKQNYQVTRVVLSKIYGPIDPSLVVAHKCDNPPCFNPKHLFICTPKENVHDMLKKERNQKGDSHWARRMPDKVLRQSKAPWSKLTESDVSNIRAEYKPSTAGRKTETSLSGLAKKYGVTFQTIHKIVRNQRWTQK